MTLVSSRDGTSDAKKEAENKRPRIKLGSSLSLHPNSGPDTKKTRSKMMNLRFLASLKLLIAMSMGKEKVD